MKEVKFLGHKVCNKGMQPEEHKVKTTRAWVASTCFKEVQMFLGAVGWYRKFIKDFSAIARPNTWLLKKDVAFTWGKEQDYAFNTLRYELVKAPVLAHPDPTRPFVVTKDAKVEWVWVVSYHKKMHKDNYIRLHISVVH